MKLNILLQQIHHLFNISLPFNFTIRNALFG
uniref:Uncharacterized protein n=1 Tax=Arundo donax TaxID=35708 RepID=A0A0A8Y0U4_ARUDO